MLARILASRSRRGVSWGDLAQIGMLTLVEESLSFDPSKGALWSYACSRVWGSMVDSVRREWPEMQHSELPKDISEDSNLFQKRRVSQALQRLDPTQRQLIRMV